MRFTISAQALNRGGDTSWYNGITCLPSRSKQLKISIQPSLSEASCSSVSDYVPHGAGKLFLVTTEDVWRLHGHKIADQIRAEESRNSFLRGWRG